MKNSIKRFVCIMVALTMMLSSMPFSLAGDVPEDAVPAVLELPAEPAEESAEAPAESPADSAEPDAAAASGDNFAPEEQTEASDGTENAAELTGKAEGEPSEKDASEAEVPEPAVQEPSGDDVPEVPEIIPAEEEAPAVDVPEEENNEPVTPEASGETEPETPEIIPGDAEEESASADVPEEGNAEQTAPETSGEAEPETPETVPEETEKESPAAVVPEEVEDAEHAVPETSGEKEPETAETVPSEVGEESAADDAPEVETADPAEEKTAEEEEPEDSETVLVDASLLVGDSWRGTFDGDREAFRLRLTVKERENLHLTTDGLPVTVDISNENTGSSRTFACRYDSGEKTWNLISEDFELDSGNYLITVAPVQAGSTGTVSLSLLPKTSVKETPVEKEAPAEEKAADEDGVPDEEENPAGEEAPAEEEAALTGNISNPFPAVVLTQTMPDGTVITVDAPEGALPYGVQMRAENNITEEIVVSVVMQLMDYLTYEEALECARYAIASGTINEIMCAYDISFYLPEAPDVEIEPALPVNVSYQNMSLDVSRGDRVETYHVDDQTGELEYVDAQRQTRNGEGEITFLGESFSTYVSVNAVPGTPTGSGNIDLAENVFVTAPVAASQTDRTVTRFSGWHQGSVDAFLPLEKLMAYAYSQWKSLPAYAYIFFHPDSWYILASARTISIEIAFPANAEIDAAGITTSHNIKNIFESVTAQVSGNKVTINAVIKRDQFSKLFKAFEEQRANENCGVEVHVPYKANIDAGTSYASVAKSIAITGGGTIKVDASYQLSFTMTLKKITLPLFYRGYGVNYTFVSDTEGYLLPDDVLAYLPEDNGDYDDGMAVKTITPTKNTVPVEDGYWVFSGYSPKSAVINKADADFTGHWKFSDEPVFHVYYDYVTSYAGDDYVAEKYLPDPIPEMLADVGRTASGQPLLAGETVTLIPPDKNSVNTDDGTWTLRGYVEKKAYEADPDTYNNTETALPTSFTIADDELELIGIWDFTPRMYRLQFDYTFTNNTEDDVALPREAVEYSDYLYRNGQTVKPTKPGTVKVYNEEDTWIGNWSYGNYSPAQVTISGDKSTDGTFLGGVCKSTVTYARQTYTWQVKHYFAGTSQTIGNGISGAPNTSLNGLLTLPGTRTSQYTAPMDPSCTLKTEGVDSYADPANFNGVFIFDHMDTSEIVIGPEHSGNATIYVPVYWRFEPYMHDVAVSFVSGTGGRTISPSVMARMQEKCSEPLQRSRYYFDEASNTWKTVNYSLTNYYPDYKQTTGEYRFEDREGSNDGYWYYYANSTYNVGNLKTADAVITVSMTMRYTPYTHKIIYQFVDENGNNLNDNAGANASVVKDYSRGSLTNNAYIYNYTYTISPKAAIPAAGRFDTINDGVWHFDGWFIREKDENGYDILDGEGHPILVAAPSDLKVRMGRGDLYVVGKWHMVPIDHRVTYTYSSGTKNVALPAALAAAVPVDETIYHKGDKVTLLPEETEFDSGDGYKWVLARSVTASFTNTSNRGATTTVANSFTMFTTYQTKTTVKLPRVWTRVATTARKVIWKNWNGTELNYAYYAVNAAPSYTTKPTRAADGEYRYAFTGWQKEDSDLAVTNWSTFPKVTAADPDPIIYTAVFTPVRQYTVAFENYDGTVLQATRVDAGTVPVYAGAAPVHASDDPVIAYEFIGWQKVGDETLYGTDEHPLPAADGDATYTAVYERKAPSFTVRFLDEDGTTVLQSGRMPYGEMPAYTGETPEKEQTTQHTFTFAGWDRELTAVTADADYTATYTQEIRSYAIRWFDGDGQLLVTDSVKYGETPAYGSTNPEPTKAKTDTIVYTFNGTWTPEITAVTGDADYTAQFTPEERRYTVTWMDADGVSVLASKNVAYAAFTAANLANTSGVTPVRDEDARAVYTFDRFELTADLEDSKTFTAVYNEQIKQYSVTYTFRQNAGDEIQMDLPEAVTRLKPEDTSLEYGTVLTADTPEVGHSVTDTHGKWRFEGWDNPGEQTVKAAIAFTGTWTYAANGLDVNYRFVSADGERTLPEAVTALLPSPAVGSDGMPYVLAVPGRTNVEESRDDTVIGTWSFLGWKLSEADGNYTEQVTLDGIAVNAIGSWAFTPADLAVTYAFAPTEGSPDFTSNANYTADGEALAGKLPEAGTAPYGSKAQPAEIAEADQTVNGTYGKWTFQGWMAKDADENLMAVPDDGQTVTTSGAAFIGLWTYIPDTHTVGYLYLSNDGTALPGQVSAKAAELTQVIAKPYGSGTEAPANAGVTRDGTVVKVLEPDTLTTRVNVSDGTWVLVENSWKLASSSSVTDVSALQAIPEEGVTVCGDVWFAAQWRFVPNSEKQVTLTLHDGLDEANNINTNLNPADAELMNLPAHPFGTTAEKDGQTYRFIGWRGESAAFATDAAIYLYSDGAAFRFSNPGIRLVPADETPDSSGARLLDWLVSRAFADGESFSLRGDLYAVWLIENPAVTAQVDLYGDLLVNGDTEHDAVPAVKPGDTVTLSAALNAAPVKEQIQSIYNSYDDPRPSELDKAAITLSDVRSVFTVKVHSAGVDLSGNTAETLNSGLKWTTDGVNGASFAVTGLEQTDEAGDDWTITITLQNADRLTTFDDLYQLIHENMMDVLTIAAEGDVTQSGGLARVTGTVEGTFYGLATLANTDAQGSVTGYHAIPFRFVWKGVQDPATSDKLNPKPISVTVQVKPEITLPGDLAVAPQGGSTFDTEHTAIYVTRPGTSLDINASLKVSAIKDQMRAVEGDYEERVSDFEDITFAHGVKCVFQVELQAQSGLTLPTNAGAYTLDDRNFKIDSVKVRGNTAAISISFKTACRTYADLHEAIINNTADVLNLKVTGVRTGDVAGAASLTGAVSGEFDATAVMNSQQIPFAFTWTGTQDKDPDGSDYVLGANEAGIIQLTVQMKPEVELPGDLLAAMSGETDYDTEHDALFATTQGSPMDYLASLKVGRVFQQMQDLVGEYGQHNPELENQLSQIVLLDQDGKRVDCTFTAVFTAQHGLSLAGVDPNDVVLKNPGKFSITGTRLNTSGNNHCLTVTMTYAPNGVTNFLELYNNIEAMARAEVQLLIPGITAEIPAGTLYLRGTVEGSFAATARFNDTIIPFAFDWKGVQDRDPDGSDMVLGKNDRGDIQLTVQVAPVEELPGDIQIRHHGRTAFTTEHDQVYTARPGDKLDYAAVLDVSSIKELITSIGDYYAGRGADEQDQILLSNLSCAFDVSMTAQPGLDLSNAAFDLPDSGSFNLTVVSRSASRAQLRCAFNPRGMDSFDKLLDNITSMPDLLVLNVDNVALPERAEIPMTLTLSGSVAGSFHGDAAYGGQTIPFDFRWNGVQEHDMQWTAPAGNAGLAVTGDGQDAILGTAPVNDIQATVVVAPAVALPGDLQVKENEAAFTTEHEKAYATHADAALTYAATLDVRTIKEQMRSVRDAYSRITDTSAITLEDLACGFTVTLTADSGLDISGAAYTLENAASFRITDRRTEGQTAVITLTYVKDPKDFAALFADIENLPDMLLLTAAGVKVVTAAGPAVMTGTVDGDFYAMAGYNGTRIPFAFIWSGEQDHALTASGAPGIETGRDGSDALLPDDTPTIQLTVTVTQETELPGDLQVKNPALGDAFTTEHENVYLTRPGASLTYAALLNVTPVKNQLLEVQKAYEAQAENQGRELPLGNILLSELECRFVVNLTAENGLTLPTEANAYQLKNGRKFQVKDVSATGQTAAITIEYNYQPASFQQLKNDIEAMDDLLELDITGVQVPDTAISPPLTLKGEVSGDFYAVATLNSHIIPFAFIWKGTQDHELKSGKAPAGLELNRDGQDAILGSTESEEIQLTVAVAPEVELPGDLQVKTPARGDAFTTEHEQVYVTESGAKLTYAATLNVTRIKEQLRDVQKTYDDQAEAQGKDLPLEEILLSELESKFIVTLSADSGLTLPAGLGNYQLKNGGSFELTGAEVSGETATLTIEYKAHPANFLALKQDIEAMDDLLELDITDVTVPGTDMPLSLTLKGEVSGGFFAMATLNSHAIPFAFDWKGIQDHRLNVTKAPEGLDLNRDGQDAILDGAEREEIQLTVAVAPVVELPGDLQVKTPDRGDAFTTEHTEVYRTNEGAVLDYAATLNVRRVFSQMMGIEESQADSHAMSLQELQDHFGRIALKNLKSSFTVLLTADAGLTLPGSPSAYNLVNERKGLFTITDVTVSGRTATLTITYDREGTITDYAQLARDIQRNVDQLLQLNIQGVRVADEVPEQYLTIRGGVTGDFYALATARNTTLAFAFRWTGVQDHRVITGKYGNDTGEGLDYLINNDIEDGAAEEDSDIWVTVEALTDARINKIWDDGSNQDGIRPASLTVALNGEEITLTAADAAEDNPNLWTRTVNGLPIFQEGRRISYTWTEKGETDGYRAGRTLQDAENRTTTITNVHAPETVSVTVKKIWDDAENQDGIRPASLRVTLSNGSTAVLSEENGWTATVEHLPKYAAGREIAYTWTEDAVPEGYELTGTQVSPDGLTTTFTNTHVPAVTGITGTKVWEDSNNSDGLRPGSITVRLLADGETVRTQTVSGAGWRFAFTDLPMYREGRLITYTVDEDAVPQYSKTITGSAAEGFVITNTHEVTPVTVSGAKIWNDNNNGDGLRPDAVTVNLLANGVPVARQRVTGAGNVWYYSFTGLSRYANGELITYTVTENPVAGYETRIQGTTITNTHRPTAVRLTVRYFYVNGTVAAPTVTQVHQPGDPYNVVSPVISGYTASLLRVSGTMPGHDVEYAVIYTPIPNPTPATPTNGTTTTPRTYTRTYVPANDPTIEIEELETPLGIGNTSLNTGECYE